MVIWMDGIRYACASCIRGHRVKQCQHQDRPLMVLAKRGRQITQCSHCRDLRKSMNSHIKCTCATHSSNGCLCEMIMVCTCVANHLQEYHS